MNRFTSTTIDRIIGLMTAMTESDKHTPLRLANIGYDVSKEPGLRDYRTMTVGQFLSTVAGYDNIPRKLGRIVEALTTCMPCSPHAEISKGEALLSEVHTAQMLPVNTSVPFFEQAVEVIETLLTATSTLSETHRKNSERISLAFNKGLNDSEIGQATDMSNERIRQIREEFQSMFMEGAVRKELHEEYSISPSFIEEARRVSGIIENLSIDSIKLDFGYIGEARFRFVIKALGFDILKVSDKEYVVKKENLHRFGRLAEEIRKSLRKEFDFVYTSSLIDSEDKQAMSFLISYLSSQTDCYEFKEDKKCVRMIGSGLSKITRLARIIFEAGDWIDKDSIAASYAQQYDGDMPTLNADALGELGFVPQNRTGKWKFGTAPAKIQELIRGIITPERPLVTFKTVLTAAVKSGLDYPESTIRAYITDIATPENKQNDLFCLKGYCHKYPNYSWRSYRKALA